MPDRKLIQNAGHRSAGDRLALRSHAHTAVGSHPKIENVIRLLRLRIRVGGCGRCRAGRSGNGPVPNRFGGRILLAFLVGTRRLAETGSLASWSISIPAKTANTISENRRAETIIVGFKTIDTRLTASIVSFERSDFKPLVFIFCYSVALLPGSGLSRLGSKRRDFRPCDVVFPNKGRQSAVTKTGTGWTPINGDWRVG